MATAYVPRKLDEDNLIMNKTNSYCHSKQKEVAVRGQVGRDT